MQYPPTVTPVQGWQDGGGVCFNGKTAGQFAPVIAVAGYETLVLSSSSPADATFSFEQNWLSGGRFSIEIRPAVQR